MAWPPLIKNWQMSGSLGSTLCVPVSSVNNSYWCTLLPLLFSFAKNAYVCRGSSNGVVGVLDNVFRWFAPTDIVSTGTATGTPRSWCCIRNPATGYEYLFHVYAHGGFSGEVIWSPAAGFTGGDANNPPTATDQKVYLDGFLFNITAGSSSPRSLCVWHTEDGQQTMIMLHGVPFGSDSPVAFILLGNVHNAPADWTYPGLVGIYVTDHGGFTPHDLLTFGTNAVRPDGTAFAAKFASEVVSLDNISYESTAEQLPFANEIDNVRDGYPYAVSANSGTFFGIKGCWPDLLAYSRSQGAAWNVGASGDFIDASKTRVIIGRHVYPWDGITVWNSTP